MSLLRNIPLPAKLIAICTLPLAAGLARLLQIAGVETPLTAYPPVSTGLQAVFVAHIVCAFLFVGLGAFQFTTHGNPRTLGWHRAAGRFAACAALLTGLSAIWLTFFYPHAPQDGPVLNVIRVFAASGIATCIVMGYRAVRARHLGHHRKWMMRAYALCVATGVQSYVVFFWHAIGENPEGVHRAFAFGVSWLACLAFVEVQLDHKSLKRNDR
ncbi:putative membrane protein DUF2306 [Shimia isoporae]|uniref:Putative membrane protein DUF2306 n=1 Tax=Shimia isoporae TaxID=647720 RepID=A0A4R1N8A1_9RHOB|nr:DUF2306 domain-containing protein [Shimia isoporae]TCK99760.1 putative membrane protein DUF2306 [Shimia isoporae]